MTNASINQAQTEAAVLSILDDTVAQTVDAQTSTVERLSLAGGEQVTITEGRSLRLASARGDLIFEYDPLAKRTVVNIPEGDLELKTQQGNIALEAAGDVTVRGQRAVDVSASAGVNLHAGDAAAGDETQVQLQPDRLRLNGSLVSLLGNRGDIQLGSLKYAGERLRGTVDDAKLVVGKLQTVADLVRHRAKNVYHTVEGLLQTRAQRARSRFEDSCHLKSKDLYLRAEKNAALDGDQVLLG